MSSLQSRCLSQNSHPNPPSGAAANLSPKPATVAAPPTTTTRTTSLLLTGVSPLLPDLPSDVREKILCLEIMGIDSEKALTANPSLHHATLSTLHAVVSFLQSKGVQQKDMGRILGMCPTILTSDPEHDLAPVFRFLSDEMAVKDSNLPKVVKKCPRLLTSSVSGQLRPALGYLRRLGFRDTEALASHDPVLLASSVEKTLMPKMAYLQKGMGLSREEAVGMVLRCPGLFTFSVERNFVPKLAFLEGEMGREVKEVKEFPQYFAFSLEKRIRPRHHRVVESGAVVSLPDMLKTTDDEFLRLIGETC